MGVWSLFGGGKDKKAEPGDSSAPAGAESPEAPGQRDQARAVNHLRRSHREKLFTLVRSALASVALPAKRYKFKVLALDAAGTSFVVMIDLAGAPDGAAAALKAVEDLICSTAAVGQDFLVQGVYWHFEPPEPPQPAASAGLGNVQAGSSVSLAQRTPTGSVLEQIGQDEMIAFRQAQSRAREQLATKRNARSQDLAAQSKALGFSETRQLEDDPPTGRSPLSPTQFGDL